MPESTSPITPLDGTTTVDDDLTFEPERLSYAAATRVARDVAAAIGQDIAGKTVVIAGDAFLADLGNLGTSKLQIDMLTDDYRRVAGSLAAQPPAVSLAGAAAHASAAVPAVAAGLQGALGLVSLLRQNVEFRGTATRIDPRAFEIALAAELRQHGVGKVIVPDLTVIRSPQAAADSFPAKWRAMQTARHAAWQAVGPLVADLGRKDAELDAASRTGMPEQVAALSREVFQLRRGVEPLTETLGQADRRLRDLQTEWEKASGSTGLTMLARLLRAEAIEGKAPRYLHAAIVSSGGHHRVSRNLFRMIFFGDGLSSMGGVVARWALLESDGTVRKGGVHAARRMAPFPSRFGER